MESSLITSPRIVYPTLLVFQLVQYKSIKLPISNQLLDLVVQLPTLLRTMAWGFVKLAKGFHIPPQGLFGMRRKVDEPRVCNIGKDRCPGFAERGKALKLHLCRLFPPLFLYRLFRL